MGTNLSTNCESLFRRPPVRRHAFYLHEPVSWFLGRWGVGYIGENSQCPTFNREIKINGWLNTLSQTSGQEPSNQPPEFRSQRVHTKAKLGPRERREGEVQLYSYTKAKEITSPLFYATTAQPPHTLFNHSFFIRIPSPQV